MNKKIAILLPIIAGVCWGITGIFTRYFDQAGLDNLTIVFTRTSVDLVLTFLCLFVIGFDKLQVARKDLLILLGGSLFGTTLFMVFYNIAVVELNLSLAAIILCTTPVFVLIVSSIIFKEKITLKKVLCMLAAFLGCVLLSGFFESDSSNHVSATGILAAVGAMLCSGIYILLTKSISDKGYHSLVLCFYGFLFATIILSPFIEWNVLGTFIISNPVRSMSMMIMQSIVTSLIPSVAYLVCLRHVDAGMTAILEGGAEPGAALIAGIILYGEIPSVLGLIGMVITVVALAILAKADISN